MAAFERPDGRWDVTVHFAEAPDQALLREGAERTLDALLERPLSRYLDDAAIETVVTLVVAAVTEPNAKRVIDQHVHPGLDRQIARSTQNRETLGDLLPPDAEAKILAVLEKTRLPRAEWAQGAVDAGLVRKLVSPVIQDTLLRFAKRLPIPGLGGEGGPSIPAPLGLGKKLLDAKNPLSSMGKGLIGGVDKKLQSVARDFAETATTDVRAEPLQPTSRPRSSAVISAHDGPRPFPILVAAGLRVPGSPRGSSIPMPDAK